ncbi:MAG TPA: aldehyde dehydrogenase family protein [Victivallales bacterium]|nr:aldehyde dehydrogenase family protein [Victivallales bacterium]
MSDIGKELRVSETLQKAKLAAGIFSQLSQEHTDKIVKAVYKAALNNRAKLAELAVEETTYGNLKDKIIKNVIASQYVYEDLKSRKTVGIISEDNDKGIVKIAHPKGPVLGIVSRYSPTSDAIFKILISLKTRNPIILVPDSAAEKSLMKVVEICYEAALKADAPEDCIQSFHNTSSDEFVSLVTKPELALIIGSDEEDIKRMAHVTAPVIGTGASNVPCYIADTADISLSVREIINSKTFDNGIMQLSEQTIIINNAIKDGILKEFKDNKAYFLDDCQRSMLNELLLANEKAGKYKNVTGKSPYEIASLAGFDIPEDTSLIMVELDGIGQDHPLSSKILAPVLSYCFVNDFHEAINCCMDINFLGNMGNTVSLFTNNNENVLKFADIMHAGRILINTPASIGAIGGWYNSMHPSFSYACGSNENSLSMDNVTIDHLLHVQTISRRRPNNRIANFDFNIYYDESYDSDYIEKAFNLNY